MRRRSASSAIEADGADGRVAWRRSRRGVATPPRRGVARNASRRRAFEQRSRVKTARLNAGAPGPALRCGVSERAQRRNRGLHAIAQPSVEL